MTKQTEKIRLGETATQFLGESDTAILNDLKEKLLSSLSSYNYDAANKQLLELSLQVFGNDVNGFILAVANKTVNTNLKLYIEYSLCSVINLVDISTLPD